jgi:hypothetical protein
MHELEPLIRLESANSGLAFRARGYEAGEQADLARDLLALANAAVQGPRHLVLGVQDAAGATRTYPGIAPQAWHDVRRRVGALAGTIDPPLAVRARSVDLDGMTVGVLSLAACNDPPYLLGERAPPGLASGAGWVRRGTQQFPLLRKDLEQLFHAKLAAPAQDVDITVGFAGDEPLGEVTLPVLGLDTLPSAVAAQKLKQVLQAKKNVRASTGGSGTRLTRLVHAQVFGMDQRYQSRSENSLRLQIVRAAEDHRVADKHYAFELRAHKLDVVLVNTGRTPLEDVVVQLKIGRTAATGVAKRLYMSAGATPAAAGYPRVTTVGRAICIEADVGRLAASKPTPAFKEPPRFWARPGAEGTTIPVHVKVSARGLREPIRETLLVHLVAPATSTAMARPA